MTELTNISIVEAGSKDHFSWHAESRQAKQSKNKITSLLNVGLPSEAAS